MEVQHMPGTHEPITIASPDIGEAEEAAVLRVLRSGRLAQGPEVAAFEESFAALQHVDHVVATSNGTTALHAALHVAGVGSGDEVLVPAFTFAASANAVMATGATPVFVDIGEHWHIDLAQARTKVTERTAAIMPVHLYGLMVDMVEVERFAATHGLAIVEDAAQAHLAHRDGIPAGSVGLGAFSFYATKNAMTGEGGVVTTTDQAQADALRRFRNHGMTDRYTHVEWGLNLRMTELQAAIGVEQLRRVSAWTNRRREIAAYFDAQLPAMFATPAVPDGAFHVFHQFTTTVPRELRDDIVKRFRDQQIGVDVYYPSPVPTQPSFGGEQAADYFPKAVEASLSIVNLPVHHQLNDGQLERIVSVAAEIAGDLG